ncbi:GNAT family N-acetyltransferase [Streptomyces sp. SAJ15]|uniref:GNAT family N-acetyltransferase n=1 Tax=Streptomyces sp. SAJ15 TaxID=2011095 RepID=UPI001186D38F|nr:GNAT family N-acetyltransferase [Streptomyces sp. SAJ15]TVL89110.1 GNAT family N-acetyltransferase [Streptomyces sp. SAJ15]
MDDLVTERLVLHPLSVAEAEALVAGEPDGTVRWAPGYPTEGDVGAVGRFLAVEADGDGPPHAGVYEIRTREDGVAVGGMGFHGPVAEDGSVTVGYGLVPAAQGKGYATEALRAVLSAARERGIAKVKGDADHANIASQRVMTGAGMELVGADEKVKYYETTWPLAG